MLLKPLSLSLSLSLFVTFSILGGVGFLFESVKGRESGEILPIGGLGTIDE